MVYMIEYRFQCRIDFHASSRFAIFMYGLMDGLRTRRESAAGMIFISIFISTLNFIHHLYADS